QRRKMALQSQGRLIQTNIKILKSFPKSEVSLVEATLLTGRTHQARAHLAALKAPVLGDLMYGPKRKGGWATIMPFLWPFTPRQLLHARRLTIPHPKGGFKSFRAPWPEDFIALWRELKRLES
ncbi:MAG: dephospho-CoA kinase, partial [Deltaproteobacteria bacterium]|nr:dephospho-CoA kinase [Deltaproteobacteria bacterium]